MEVPIRPGVIQLFRPDPMPLFHWVWAVPRPRTSSLPTWRQVRLRSGAARPTARAQGVPTGGGWRAEGGQVPADQHVQAAGTSVPGLPPLSTPAMPSCKGGMHLSAHLLREDTRQVRRSNFITQGQRRECR